MIRDAVTCDRVGGMCLAVYLEPEDLDPDAGLTFETALEAAGWATGPDGHLCPACADGCGPVLELGECPRCMGRTGWRANGEYCLYCGGHIEPDDD
ncbi:hypothetical protein [Streptomyces albus]|uniref:hypothetical protein n=1 Tax=Streptomyces albus TaxID=1888 RepID=UPI0024E08CC9|nr:hypothetical protein [Streptomyces albus]GHJ24434.1 hypothetical protein TPA0909_60480 [Streptomyces albus]